MTVKMSFSTGNKSTVAGRRDATTFETQFKKVRLLDNLLMVGKTGRNSCQCATETKNEPRQIGRRKKLKKENSSSLGTPSISSSRPISFKCGRSSMDSSVKTSSMPPSEASLSMSVSTLGRVDRPRMHHDMEGMDMKTVKHDLSSSSSFQNKPEKLMCQIIYNRKNSHYPSLLVAEHLRHSDKFNASHQMKALLQPDIEDWKRNFDDVRDKARQHVVHVCNIKDSVWASRLINNYGLVYPTDKLQACRFPDYSKKDYTDKKQPQMSQHQSAKRLSRRVLPTSGKRVPGQ